MTRSEFITTAEVAWSNLLPDYTIPNVAILLSWYRWYTISTVIAAIEDISGFVNRKGPTNFDSDAVGRIVSSTARKMQAQKLAANPAYEPPFPQR